MTSNVEAAGPFRDAADGAPKLRPATVEDITESLKLGLDDFRAYPRYGLVLGALYALGGMMIFFALQRADMAVMAYPALAGFALVGPFAAVGLYEVSRRRELGLPVTWGAVLGVMRGASSRQILMLGFALIFVTLVWTRIALIIYALFFGMAPVNFGGMVHEITSTTRGFSFFVIGNAAGAIFALATFSISVLSFPLMLDRDVDVITGIVTSVKAVIDSPRVMIGWGLLIAFMLVAAWAPFFLGLLLVLPILGHASWRLYRRLVVTD